MPVRDLIGAQLHVLATSKASFNSTTEAAFDFGSPNDIDLSNTSAYEHGDRVLVVVTATTAGTTDTLSLLIYDADDNEGSIGTPAAAVVDHPSSTYNLSAGTGDHYMVASVRLQAGRPWLRIGFDADGTTDTFALTCVVLGVPTSI